MIKFTRGNPSLSVIISSIADIISDGRSIGSTERGGPSGVPVGSAGTESLGGRNSMTGGFSDYPSLMQLDEILSALEGVFSFL